ncbi:acyltransferase [Leeia sp. TBRC 13508]|uniref:Acyltransferase n=1 Tax=Leeia speluncae TaxID=2884804 RepID=A0ABS8D1V5_9NEIS|nr:acyltransferase [Leeia speluncae]MCB6182155.1 acyltransferase [Leeia speluncae]
MNQPAGQVKHDPVAFAHLLRGLSALAVLIFHYVLMFWQRPARVADLTGMPVLATGSEAFVGHQALIAWLPINLGAIAVGALFLLSGFVLPFSFRPDTTRTGFLIARCFRILPTYWGGFLVSCGLVAIVAALYAHPFPYTMKDVLLHLFPGPRDLLGGANIDGIVWTLDVEMKFYALALLFAPLIKRASRWVLLMPFGLFATGVVLDLLAKPVYPTLSYLLFASIGIVFHWHYRGQMKLAEAAIWMMTGVAMFFWMAVKWFAWPGLLSFSYVLALVVFVAAYASREKINLHPVTRWLADVSYPLYCVHAVSGYILIRCLLMWGVPAVVAILLAAANALILATLLHRYLEVPSPQWGRSLIKKLQKNTG